MPHCSYGAKPTLGLTKPTSSVRDEATESAPGKVENKHTHTDATGWVFWEASSELEIGM